MSRSTVRQAIATWLAPPAVAGINRVYTSHPALMTGFYGTSPGTTGGAVLAIHLAADTETRLAVGGPHSGKKRVDYSVELHVYFRSMAVAATDGSDPGEMAADALDTIIGNLKDRIRADRQAGTGYPAGAVWQWGEANFTGQYGELSQDGDGACSLWAVVKTDATEFLTT